MSGFDMKISDLIKKLEEIKEESGDLEVDLNHEGEYLTLPVLVVHIDPRTLEQKLIIT